MKHLIEKIAKFEVGALIEEELISKNYEKVTYGSSGFENNNEVSAL